jgi:hypothetical protein
MLHAKLKLELTGNLNKKMHTEKLKKLIIKKLEEKLLELLSAALLVPSALVESPSGTANTKKEEAKQKNSMTSTKPLLMPIKHECDLRDL